MLGHGVGIGYTGPGWAPLTISVWWRGRLPDHWTATNRLPVSVRFATQSLQKAAEQRNGKNVAMRRLITDWQWQNAARGHCIVQLLKLMTLRQRSIGWVQCAIEVDNAVECLLDCWDACRFFVLILDTEVSCAAVTSQLTYCSRLTRHKMYISHVGLLTF